MLIHVLGIFRLVCLVSSAS